MRAASAIAVIMFLSTTMIECNSTHAGAVEGPYVIWMNLSKNEKSNVDDIIRKYLNSGDDLCWNISARMYMRTRPTDITESLIRDGLINQSSKSQSTIRSILNKPFEEVNGFDGIIAFTDSPNPQLISYSLKGKIKRKLIDTLHDEASLKVALCTVMPDVERRP